MSTLNLGQVAAYINSVAATKLDAGAEPTVENTGTKQNADLVFGIPTLNVECTSGLIVPTPRWLRFSASNKKALVIKAYTLIKVGENVFLPTSDTAFDLSSYISTAGADYFVYLNYSEGTWSLSATTTKTDDTDTSRYIGRFHTLCVDAGSSLTMTAPSHLSAAVGDSYLIKPYSEAEDPDFYAFYNKTVTAITDGTYYDVVTVPHPLAGFSAGDIIPESVWCLTWKPTAYFEDAMVYDKATDIACDIYLQMGRGINTRSSYSTTTKPANSLPQIVHQRDMLQVGKQLLSDTEFSSIALGSNEQTNIYGSASVNSSGGHKDTASRRMISAIGVEDCCGFLWQWLRDVAPLGTGTAYTSIGDTSGNVGNSGWITEDGQDNFGQMYNCIAGLLAGGHWCDGADCSSGSRSARDARSRVYSLYGARGSSRVKRII